MFSSLVFSLVGDALGIVHRLMGGRRNRLQYSVNEVRDVVVLGNGGKKLSALGAEVFSTKPSRAFSGLLLASVFINQSYG